MGRWCKVKNFTEKRVAVRSALLGEKKGAGIKISNEPEKRIAERCRNM